MSRPGHLVQSSSRTIRRLAPVLLAWTILLSTNPGALALITGGTGNNPLPDPGWPQGAAALFNHKARVAWWEGPPFGGGQWHSECRGSAQDLNALLAAFANLKISNKRVIIHDGPGASFWLNTMRQQDPQLNVAIDWSLTIWQPDHFKRLQQLPKQFRSPEVDPALAEPPAQLDIYTGGNIAYSDLKFPDTLSIEDHRLEVHGFQKSDGTVLEGTVLDLITKQPIPAEVHIDRIFSEPSGYKYAPIKNTTADANGRWVLKNIPRGWYRIVAVRDGYIARVAGYAQPDDTPRWTRYDTTLSPPALLAGRVLDDAGNPLAGAQIRLDKPDTGERKLYEPAYETPIHSDPDGHFHTSAFPAGQTRVWPSLPGYVAPGLGLEVTLPASEIVLTMQPAARAEISVDFSQSQRPQDYIVSLIPEGGEAVGKWSGSASINAQNQLTFMDVPPGRYIARGRPNPGSDDQLTDPITVNLQAGQTAQIKLKARPFPAKKP